MLMIEDFITLYKNYRLHNVAEACEIEFKTYMKLFEPILMIIFKCLTKKKQQEDFGKVFTIFREA